MSVPNGTQTASEIREVPPSFLLFAISIADPQGSSAPSPLFLFSKLPQKSLPITADAVAAFTYPELPPPGGKATALSSEDFAICFTDGRLSPPLHASRFQSLPSCMCHRFRVSSTGPS
jgi:hypothetical protein